MYIYKYVHTWPAARNVKKPPANNYAALNAFKRETSGRKYRFVSITRTFITRNLL